MRIAVVNTSSVVDSEVASVVRAINRQIKEDFAPEWDLWAMLRQVPRELAYLADAVIYVANDSSDSGILGYHSMDAAGLPYGYIFTSLSAELGEPWSVTFSHEALELLGDSTANAYALGPHPAQRSRDVLHWWEMCDSVQARSYAIDGVAVSDFVLPHFFTPGEEKGRRNAFLGPVRSFTAAPGGYLGFYDPQTGESDTFFADQQARDRHAAKARYAHRRSFKYRKLGGKQA